MSAPGSVTVWLDRLKAGDRDEAVTDADGTFAFASGSSSLEHPLTSSIAPTTAPTVRLPTWPSSLSEASPLDM